MTLRSGQVGPTVTLPWEAQDGAASHSGQLSRIFPERDRRRAVRVWACARRNAGLGAVLLSCLLVVSLALLGAGAHVARLPPNRELAQVQGRSASFQRQTKPETAPSVQGSSGAAGSSIGVVATLPTGSGPVSATYDAGNGYTYVPNTNASTVSILNGTLVKANVTVGFGPTHSAYDPANGWVYVPVESTGNVSVISGTSIEGNVSTATGYGPYFAVYDSGNHYIYVADLIGGAVSVISGTSLVATIHVGTYPFWEAYDAQDGYVYVSNFDSHNVSVIDGTSLLATIPVGQFPYFSIYDSGNGYVYVSNVGSSNVSVIQGTSIVGTVSSVYGPGLAAYDQTNGYVYLPEMSGSVGVISGTTLTTTIAMGSGTTPMFATYDPSSGYVFVSDTSSSGVGVINGTSLLTTVSVAPQPQLSVYDADNGYVYVPNNESGEVSVLGSSAPPVATTYSVTFTESGLPSGAPWSVTLNGARASATAPGSIIFTKSNETYPFTVGTVSGYAASPSSGSVTVNGAAVSKAITFTAAALGAYSVTFVETGLPTGTNWSVSLNGSYRYSTTTTLSGTLPNGTYNFGFHTTASYTASPASMNVTVAGSAVVENVTFSPTAPSPSAGFFGLPGALGYYILGGGAVAVLAGAAVALALRARRPRGQGPGPSM